LLGPNLISLLHQILNFFQEQEQLKKNQTALEKALGPWLLMMTTFAWRFLSVWGLASHPGNHLLRAPVKWELSA
jgi:hypothetical protein